MAKIFPTLSTTDTLITKELNGQQQTSQWVHFSFLFSLCGLLFSALLAVFLCSVSSGMSGLSLPVFSLFVCCVLIVSTVFSAWALQKICGRIKPLNIGIEWLAVAPQILQKCNSPNVYLDWVCRYLLAPRNTFCESEAIRRMTDSLVSNTIAPWYSNIGDNDHFSQQSCLIVRAALLNISRLVRQLNMKSLARDLTLIIHRHLKKQVMCRLTGSTFRAEHPVSLGKSSLDCYLDSQVTTMMEAVLPHCMGNTHCLPVKMVKQVGRRIMVKKLEILQLGFGVRGTVDKNLSQKEQDKETFAIKSGKIIGVNTDKL
jgi:hypothetical protein